MAPVIFTTHAKERLKERKIPENLVIQAISTPDKTLPNEQGGIEYHKKVGYQTVIAVAKRNEEGEDVIVSCWVNPPNTGTKDFKKNKRYFEKQKASNLKKFWLTLLDQLGL